MVFHLRLAICSSNERDRIMKTVTIFLQLSILILICINCTPKSTSYQSGSLETARMYFAMSPEMVYDPSLVSEQKEREKEYDLDRYKTILEQKFQLMPPVSVLLLIPPQSRYKWWYYDDYGTYSDSLKSMIIHALREKLKKTDFVNEIRLAASIFTAGTVEDIQEIAARYRADECLLVSYNLCLWHTSTCLGFWPVNSLKGEMTSETMLIDTRTGFFLTGSRYSILKNSSSDVLVQTDRKLEVMQLIVDDLTEAIVSDLLEFYENESLP